MGVGVSVGTLTVLVDVGVSDPVWKSSGGEPISEVACTGIGSAITSKARRRHSVAKRENPRSIVLSIFQ
jgi:hypothetical protein